MTATAAEVIKTAENTFQDLQIVAANEFALYCEAMEINFYDVRNGIDSLKEKVSPVQFSCPVPVSEDIA